MKVALALGAVTALVLLPRASAASTFTDPVGDQRNTPELTAPDITSVEVSNTRAGVITFRITIATPVTLPPRSRIAVLFDLDRRQATGLSGFDYTFSHEVTDARDARLLLERWDAVALELVALPTTNVTSTFAGGVYTLTIPRSVLAGTIGFDFGVYAAALDLARIDRSAVDDAPNANLWSYDLENLPPPRLVASMLAAAPTAPVAGRPFSVTSVVRRLDDGRAITSSTGRVTCAARVGRTPLRARGGFGPRTARCLIAIPRAAKGRLLTGALTVRAHGASVTRRFSFRVR